MAFTLHRRTVRREIKTGCGLTNYGNSISVPQLWMHWQNPIHGKTFCLHFRSATLDALAESHSWKDFLSALKVRNIDIRFNRSQASDKVHGVSFSQDGISLAGSTLDRDLSFNSLCTTLGSLTEELLLQPHQASLCTTLGNLTEELLLQPHQAIISSAGGGTSNSLGWRDEKDKNSPKNEPFYKPLKRGR